MSGNDHTDAEAQRRAHNYEMGEDEPGDAAWLAWAAEVETLGAGFMGKDHHGKPTLDGDQTDDGYSIDGAYDAYERRRETPAAYIAHVRALRTSKGLVA